MAELKKQAGWSDTQPRLSHFRTQTGLEVDVILKDRQGRCVGVEVKAGATAAVKDFRGLKALRELLGERFVRGVVLYTGRDVIPFAAALHALPVSALWQLNARTV